LEIGIEGINIDALLIAGPGFFLIARNVHWIFQRITEVTLHGYLNKYPFRSIYKICVRVRPFSGLKNDGVFAN